MLWRVQRSKQPQQPSRYRLLSSRLHWSRGNPGTFGTFPDPQTYGVQPLNISSRLHSGLNHLRFDLINDGGPYGNSDIYLVTNCGKTETQNLTFNPGSNVQQQATANCGSTDGGACPNPDASSMKFTFEKVMQQFHLQVTFTEVDGDGVCEMPPSGNANDSTDFDCTWANFFGDSKPQYGLTGSDGVFNAPFFFVPVPTTVHVPYCLHYAHNNTKCVDIDAELLDGTVGTHFSGQIQLYVAWNAVTSSLFPLTGGFWGAIPLSVPAFTTLHTTIPTPSIIPFRYRRAIHTVRVINRRCSTSPGTSIHSGKLV